MTVVCFSGGWLKPQILEKRAKIKSRDAGGWAGEILMRVGSYRQVAISGNVRIFLGDFMGDLWWFHGDIIDQLDVIFGSVTSTKWLLFRAVPYISRQTQTEISYEFAGTLGRHLPTKNMIENWEDE